MSCPVVKAMKELHGGYDYSQPQTTNIVTPSGFQGGGVTTQAVCLDNAIFYKTFRKLQFARAELNSGKSSDSDLSITNALSNVENVYFERMFADYYGKTSQQLLEKILEPTTKKMYAAITRTVDIIDIMESICASTLAKEHPDSMSLPTVDFSPEVVELLISNPSAVGKEISKIITYANQLCVGGIRAKIEPLEDFTQQCDVTFTKGESYQEMFKKDMELADYACKVEEFYRAVLGKLSEVIVLCQSIIDL